MKKYLTANDPLTEKEINELHAGDCLCGSRFISASQSEVVVFFDEGFYGIEKRGQGLVDIDERVSEHTERL